MKIFCVGLDPAGLYLACLLKAGATASDVTIVEAGPPATIQPPHIMRHPLKSGWALADAEVARAVDAASRTVSGVRVRAGECDVATEGQAYAFIAAPALRDILRGRARALGCGFAASATDADLARADLVIIADGAQSALRAQGDAFTTTITPSKTRHAFFDVELASDKLEFWFRRMPWGIVHAMLAPSGASSTLFVETTQAVVSAAGLAEADTADVAHLCDEMFAGELEGRTLFPRGECCAAFDEVRNARWSVGNRLLIGAAAYTTHPTVGLDARTAMADAEAYARALLKGGDVAEILKSVEAAIRPKGAESLRRAARESLTWFENVHRYIDMPGEQFAFSCLTRTMRVTHERLKQWAPALVDEVDALAAGPVRGRNGAPPPPMFTPFRMRELTLPNRIVMSPMCMYSAEDGEVNDFHMVHYGSRAMGGAGLLICEMSDVSPEGRISPGCAGMYKPAHVPAWKRIVDFVHQRTETKIGVQLAHAGRKGSCCRPWEGHSQLPPDQAWTTLAPSAIPFDVDRAPPRAMDRADMDRVRDAFVNGAHMANEAGFDMIEVHFAHGYLLSSFISPLSNRRTDEYGGSLENRLRWPLEVLRAVRAAWPAQKPITVRISAHDLLEGGITEDDSIIISRWLHQAGADMITASTGAVTAHRRPMVGRLYQTTYSDQIRNETKIPTMTVGGVASYADANTIIAAGRADLVALARGYMFDPYFPHHTASQQGYQDLRWPPQYRGANVLKMRDF